MSGAKFRKLSVFLLVSSLLASSAVLLPGTAEAYSWSDDFSGPALDPMWVKGGIGTLGIRPEEGTLHALTYTGDYVDVWHGPFIRTQMPEFGDFDIDAEFRCIAQERQISRLMVRVLDSDGGQLYSFGWSDVLSSDSKAEIGLYGASFSEPLFRTGASYTYSNFYDRNIRLSRSGSSLSFYVNGESVHLGDASGTPASYMDIAFLKYQGECTIETLDLNSISVSATAVGSDDTPSVPSDSPFPSEPRNFSVVSGNRSAALFWNAPSTTGSAPLLGFRVYRGVGNGSAALLAELGLVQKFIDSGLSNGQTYHYSVAAFNSNGEGPPVNGSATPEPLAVDFTVDSGDLPDSGSWTDDFTLTSAFVMLLALAVGSAVAFMFLRNREGGSEKKTSGKQKGSRPRKKKMKRR